MTTQLLVPLLVLLLHSLRELLLDLLVALLQVWINRRYYGFRNIHHCSLCCDQDALNTGFSSPNCLKLLCILTIYEEVCPCQKHHDSSPGTTRFIKYHNVSGPLDQTCQTNPACSLRLSGPQEHLIMSSHFNSKAYFILLCAYY